MGTRNFMTTMAKNVYILNEDITKNCASYEDWIDNIAPSEIASHLAVNINAILPHLPILSMPLTASRTPRLKRAI